jgi:predicted Zn finger-like uncharacterized protein
MTSSSSQPVFCPTCHARYEVASEQLRAHDVVLLCGLCGRGFNVREASSARLSTTDEVTAARAQELGARIVVGHEQPGAARTLASVLRHGGFSPLCLARGEQVLSAFDPTMPELPVALCLDVGIPGVLAFEVIAHLRASPHTATLPIVLLASVFERTRYKRRPNRLYGADTYLELHHVPDRLLEVIHALSVQAPLDDERRQAPSERAAAAPLRDLADLSDDDAVRVQARRTLMDIALYHGDEIGHGLKGGDPFVALRAPLDEGCARLMASSPDTVRAREIFDEELQVFTTRLSERERTRRVVEG